MPGDDPDDTINLIKERRGKYAGDRPPECVFCHFWVNDKVGCRLGKMNCCYLLECPRMAPTPCDGCPYGKAIARPREDGGYELISGHRRHHY